MEVSYHLKGKTLVVSDIHIGLKKANQSRLSIVITVFKDILETIKAEHVENVICCGDVFHSRVALDLQALNVGIKLLSALASKCKCYLIVGNHDLYYKNTASVHSSNVFKHIENVYIVDKTTEVEINGQKALFVPWLGTFEECLEKSYYDLMFGHFDINGKYLIASYIEEHSGQHQEASNDEIQAILDNDSLLNETSNIIDIRHEFSEIKKNNLKSNDLVGDFVEYVKPMGVVYAGHIHGHKEFVARSREFIFVGSPYQQNFGEIDNNTGFYVLDENNKRKFHPITNVPRHIRLKMSEILNNGIDNFDFSIVKNNIVQKIYDIDIDLANEAKINQKIVDNKPFEEALPEYAIALSSENNIVFNEEAETIKHSKLDYIKQYVDNIDQKTLDEEDVDKGVLYKTLETYFNLAMENLKQ